MKKILVVDDDLDILTAINLILTRNSFNVEMISDWKNIPHAIKSYSPDLILLDVSLSGADGREICSKLKKSKQTGHIPIILVSAYYNLINNLKDCGADDIIAKPFDVTHLLDRINNNLN
jgi:two-component system phosphate regulon response regulator PhoB